MSTIWILILIATVAWGFWGILDKKALETASPPVVLLISVVTQGVVALLALVALKLTNTEIAWKPETVMWAGLSGVAVAVGLVAYLYALSQRDASWVLGITAGYPALMVILAVVLLGETVSMLRLAGIATVVIGVYLIGLD